MESESSLQRTSGGLLHEGQTSRVDQVTQGPIQTSIKE